MGRPKPENKPLCQRKPKIAARWRLTAVIRVFVVRKTTVHLGRFPAVTRKTTAVIRRFAVKRKARLVVRNRSAVIKRRTAVTLRTAVTKRNVTKYCDQDPLVMNCSLPAPCTNEHS